jgi:hypothetical protein
VRDSAVYNRVRSEHKERPAAAAGKYANDGEASHPTDWKYCMDLRGPVLQEFGTEKDPDPLPIHFERVFPSSTVLRTSAECPRRARIRRDSMAARLARAARLRICSTTALRPAFVRARGSFALPFDPA